MKLHLNPLKTLSSNQQKRLSLCSEPGIFASLRTQPNSWQLTWFTCRRGEKKVGLCEASLLPQIAPCKRQRVNSQQDFRRKTMKTLKQMQHTHCPCRAPPKKRKRKHHNFLLTLSFQSRIDPTQPLRAGTSSDFKKKLRQATYLKPHPVTLDGN